MQMMIVAVTKLDTHIVPKALICPFGKLELFHDEVLDIIRKLALKARTSNERGPPFSVSLDRLANCFGGGYAHH